MEQQRTQARRMFAAFNYGRCAVAVLFVIGAASTSFGETIEARRDSQGSAIVIEKYQGDFSTLISNGYMPSNGATVKGTPLIAGDYFLRGYCKPYIKKHGFDCVWVIANLIDHQSDGSPNFNNGEMLRIKVPNPLRIMETDDTLCKSSKFPDAHILTIGSWRWRKPPLVGGYAYSIKRAWRVDLAAMQFRKIPTLGVSCVINADRN